MGKIQKISNYAKDKMRETRFNKLVKECERLYATHPLAEWQRERIAEIRALGEFKCKVVDDKAMETKRRMVEEFMQFEIDFIYASTKFRQEHPGEEMKLAKESKVSAFFKDIVERAKALGNS